MILILTSLVLILSMWGKNMKNIIKYWGLVGLFLISSCNGNKNEDIKYVDLASAINNSSRNYSLSILRADDSLNLYEVYNDDFIYYAPDSGGYIKADDSNYYHGFKMNYIYEDDSNKEELEVYGKGALLESKESLNTSRFIDIIKKYQDDFTKVDENTYSLSVKDMAYDLKNYFQSRNYVYTNYFELDISKDGTLDKFISYEGTKDDKYVVGTAIFKEFNLDQYDAYKSWVKDGSKINTRIYDLKLGYIYKDNSYLAFYENDNVTIEGIINSIDYDGNIYIANSDDTTGNVGIRVSLKDKANLPKINTKIKVSGVVKVNDYVSYIDNATYVSIEESSSYPYFEEEAISNSYGGGYYLANIFSTTPIYGDSVYSTYAYVNKKVEINLIENKKVEVELIFPKMVNSQTGVAFKSKLVLPLNMPLETKNEILKKLSDFKVYGIDSDAKEINLEKCLIKIDTSLEYNSYLEFSKFSEVSNSLTPEEKISKYVGLNNLKIVDVSNYTCFRFGENTSMSLESIYDKKGSQVGVYYETYYMNNDQYNEQINNILSLGFTLSDRIKDEYYRIHDIYKYQDYVIDIYKAENPLEEDTLTFNMWVYKGEVVQGLTIKEKLLEAIPYFNSDDFIIPNELYSKDISLFKLNGYGGNRFSDDNLLTVVTLDTNDNIYTSLRNRYINELGYKTYRNEDNSMYTYQTRGSNHYVLYKKYNDKENIYLDFSMYSTNDYTFSGHSDFTNRIEIAIYKGSKPLSTNYETNLDNFSKELSKFYGMDEIKFSGLPNDTKVEMYYADSDYERQSDNLDYGYYGINEAFIYSKDLTKVYDSLVKSLTDYGYEESFTTSKGNICYNYVNSDENISSYLFIIKDSSKNYIRIMDGVGGIDF